MKSLALAFSLAVAALCCDSAQAQIAVVMSPNAAPLSKEQVANLFLGRTYELHPLDLPEGSPLRDQFYKKATDREPSQIKATWARVVFAGKSTRPEEEPDIAAMKKAVAANPKAIGYIDKAAVDASVKVVLSLD